MSSGNSTLDSEYAAQYRMGVIENSLAVAAAALLLYDTAITFGQEVKLVWKRRQSATTFLFVINRILGVMLALSLVITIPNWWQLQECMGIMIYSLIPELALFLVWASFSALRVYAIGGLAWRTAAFVFFLAIIPFATNLYLCAAVQIFESSAGCNATTNISASTSVILEVVARGSMIASDSLVLLVTWRHTYNVRKHGNAVGTSTSLATLLLRDGTLFFLAGLILNAAELITYVKYGGVDIAYWVTSASCIITSRFILSLRLISERQLNQSSSGGVTSTLQIASGITATMGADIDISYPVYSNSHAYDDCEGPVEGDLSGYEG